MATKKDNLIWIDLEMTGLIPGKDRIIEIATIVTNSNLEIIATGPELAIKQPAALLNSMNEWCATQHAKSGLLDRIATAGVDIADAEQETLEFLKQYVAPNSSPMCGNSICQDRRFLFVEMRNLEQFFHYRHLDVSSIKVLAQNWAPHIFELANKKASSHRAKDDILESIQELKVYREHFFKI